MNAAEYLVHWKKNRVWTHLDWPKHQRRFELCASMLEGSDFVDIGCIYGHSTNILAGFLPGQWTGLDFVEEAVIGARELFPQYEFLYSPNYDMASAVGGRFFDSAVCSEVLEHVDRDAEFLAEMIRIVNHRIILTTPNRLVNDPGHLRCYTRESLGKLLAGLKHEIISDGPFFYVKVDLA